MIWTDKGGAIESFSRLQCSEFEDSDSDEVETDNSNKEEDSATTNSSNIKEQDSDPVDTRSSDLASSKHHGGANAQCIVNEVTLVLQTLLKSPLFQTLRLQIFLTALIIVPLKSRTF